MAGRNNTNNPAGREDIMDAIIAAVFNNLLTIINTSSLRSSRAVTWERVAPSIICGIVPASLTTTWGETRTQEIAFRIDGRAGRGNGYRVDVKTLSFTPWEAIDGGVPCRTIADAKKLVRIWLRGGSSEVEKAA